MARKAKEAQEGKVQEVAEGEEQPEYELVEDNTPDWLKRSPAFVISVVLHGLALFIASLITYMHYQAEEEAKLIAKRPPKKQDYDEKKKRAMHKTPKIINAKPVEKPIVVLEEEVVKSEVPKGTDMNNLANKDLDSNSVIDAYGVGGGAAGAYGSRFGKGSLNANGGGEGTEAAVYAALRWLANHQASDGRWDIDGYSEMCKGGKCAGPGGYNNEGIGDSHYDVGVTSLALLAFLGYGNTHRVGEFKDNVRSGLNWLKKQQKSGGELDGSIGVDPGHDESIYNHALATMAISETYAVTKDPMYKKLCDQAVAFCLKAQNQSGDVEKSRGWKYGIRSGKNDTSVTGWMVFALKAAKNGGVEIPKICFEGSRNWFDQVTDERGVCGYQTKGGGSSYIPSQKGKYEAVPCMTAVATVCRLFMGAKKSDAQVQNGRKILSSEMPQWKPGAKSTINMYYWYYGTYAYFEATEVGSADWNKWNKAMQESLLPTQRQGGCEDGSWDPLCEWGLAGGRVYSTAIGALTLEVYYRYERQG